MHGRAAASRLWSSGGPGLAPTPAVADLIGVLIKVGEASQARIGSERESKH
jgi:hypothetical protein